MPRPHLAVPLLLALALPCRGQDPGPAPLPVAPVFAEAHIEAKKGKLYPGNPIWLRGEASRSARPLKWSVIAPKVPFDTYDQPDDPASGRKGLKSALLVIWDPKPDTTYRFAVVATGDDGGNAFDFIDVKVEPVAAPKPPAPVPPAPTPGPAPQPAPAPTPDPAAVSGPLYAILFFDLNDTSVTSLRVSRELRDELAKLDVTWYELASTAPAAQPYLAELASDGTPVVVFQSGASLLRDPAGKVVAVRAPKSAADVLGRAKALRGQK